MKLLRLFLSIFILIGFVIGVFAQDIDDDEQEIKPEDLKRIGEKTVLPIQPPKPKPTPIEIQPIEPKPEQRQRFLSPQPIIAPEKEPVGLPSRQWFKPVAPVTAPDYQNPYNPQGVSSINFNSPSQVTGASSQYSMAILQDFRGGLNLVDFPNKIADNEATEQQNFIWSSAGKLEPRSGFGKYNTTEFDAGERIFGLYPYYTPDGDKILLAGVNGTLWADTNNARTVDVSVKTGLQSNDKYYDFETFKGKAIVVHEGDYPFWYDGNTTEYIGLADSGKGGLVVSGDIGGDTCHSFILTGDTKTSIEIRAPRPGEKARRRRTDPPLTIYDRSNQTYYETDRWVGYTVRFVDTLGINYWSYVTANIEDTLYLEGQPAESTLWAGTYYIYSYFDYEHLDNWIIMATKGHHCYDTLTLSGSCSIYDDVADSGCVLRMTQGFSSGNEHFVINAQPNVTNCDFFITESFDSIQTSFNELALYRKRFWKPGIVEIFKNRVFFANIENFENLIVFSSYNRLGDFPPDNYFLVKTEDGDKVTALATFYDDQLGYKDRSRDCLVIFKENSIYKMIWNSATDYYLVQVAEGIGCVASQSIVNVEGKYLLFLHTTGVYAFDGRTVTLVSAKVKPLLDGIAKTQYAQIVAGYYDRHYYLNYPEYPSGYNRSTLVFNIDFGSWAEATGIWTSFYCQQNAPSDTCKLLFAHISKSFIYEFGNATTDTGQAISLVYKSKAFDFNSIADRKRFTYFDMDYYLTSGNFSAYFYTDFGDSLRYNKTVSESGGYRYKRLPLDADCLGRNFSFKITSSNHLELGKVGLKFKKIGE